MKQAFFTILLGLIHFCLIAGTMTGETPSINSSPSTTFSLTKGNGALPPNINFQIGTPYCDNNGTPCDPSDDNMCVKLTFNEIGLFNIGWKSCITGALITSDNYTIANLGQSVTVCIPRTTAIASNCGNNNLALLWTARQFGGFEVDNLFLEIPASCSSGTSLPSPSSISNATGCAGQLTLGATCSSGVPQWYSTPTPTLNSATPLQTGDVFTKFFTSNTTYYVSCKGTNTNACESARVPVTATITPGPAVNSSATQTITSGSPLNYNITSATAGTTFTWSRAAVLGVSNATVVNQTSDPITEILVNTTTSLKTVKYSITATSNTCAGAAFTLTVTVLPAGTCSVSLGPDATICRGTSRILTPISTPTVSSYTWRVNSDPSFTTTASSVSVDPTSTTNYYITLTTTSGCKATDEITITVNPRPTINSSTVKTIISGVPLNYDITSSNVAATFVWSRAAVAGISNAAAINETSDPITETLINTSPSPVTVIYSITPTANGCTGTVFTLTVTVNPQNSSPSSPICDNNGTPCDPTDDKICVTTTFSEAGEYQVAWRNCTPDSYVEPALVVTVAAGETRTFCVNRAAALNANCINNTAVILFKGKLFGDFAAETNFIAIPASCSIETSAQLSTPTVTNNSGCSGTNIALKAVCPNGKTQWYTATTGGAAFATDTTFTSIYTSSTTYYVSCKNANGCESARVPVTATVILKPVINSATVKTITSGVPLNYDITSATTGTTFSWSRALVAGISNAAAINQTADPITETLINTTPSPITVNYSITPTANGCVGVAFILTITVLPVGTCSISLGADAVICLGTPRIITATGMPNATIYTWKNSTGSANVLSQNSVTVTPTITTTYYITATDPTGACSATDEMTIIVNPRPTINSSTVKTITSGAPLNYDITSTTTGATFSWSRAAVTGISNAAVTNQTTDPITETLINTTTSSVNVIYSITPTANGCTGTAFPLTVTVNPQNSSPSSPICDNNGTPCDTTDDKICVTTTFSEAGEYRVGWKNCTPDSFIDFGLVTVAAGETKTFCVNRAAALNANCINNSQVLFFKGKNFGNFFVETNFITIPASCSIGTGVQLATPSVTGSSGCVGTNIVLSASCPNGTPQWYTTTTDETPIATGNSYTSTYNNTTTYYVSCKNLNGCESARVPVTATVNSKPSAPSTSGASRCGTGTVTLIASGCSGGTLNWYTSAIGGSLLMSGSSYSPNLSSTTTYYVECQANDCASSRTAVTGTITSMSVINSAATKTVNSGSSLNYDITSATTGTTFSWSRAAVAGISNAAITNQTTDPITEALINTTTSPITVNYSIIPTSNGCSGAAFTLVVTVMPTVTCSVSLGADLTICEGETRLLTSSTTSAASFYTWKTNLTTSPIQTSISTITVNPTVTTTYTVTLTTTTGCTAIDEMVIKVNPKSGVPTITNNAGCAGSNIVLTALSTNGITQWYSTATATTVLTTGSTYTAAYSSNTTYYVSCKNANGCESARIPITATVNPRPVVNAGADVSICDQSTILTALVSSGTAPFSYAWSPVTGLSSSTTASVIVNPASTTIYTVIVTDAKGCTNFDGVGVTKSCNTGGGSCGITNITAVPTCTPNSSTYSLSGVVYYTSPPSTGTLELYLDNVLVQTFNPPFATNTPYTIPNLAMNGINRRVTAFFTTTNTATYLAPSLVSISTQPAGFTECVGGTKTLTVIGSNITNYQWQSSLNNITFTNISGATGSSYIPPSTIVGRVYYRVLVTNLCSSASSSSATVTIVADPIVTATANPAVITTGKTSKLTASVTGGTGTVTYRWQIQTAAGWSTIGTSATYTTPALLTTTQYRSYITQTGIGCGATSFVTVTVTAAATNARTAESSTSLIQEKENEAIIPVEEDDEVVLFPNPVSDFLNIQLLDAEGGNLSLYDIAGRIVLENKLERENSISVGHLTKGIYLAKISINDRLITRNIVVE